MVDISKFSESKYMKKEDIHGEPTLTIKSWTEDNLAQEGEPKENKCILHWVEQDVKPLVMNATNLQIIARDLQSTDTDNWIGAKVVLYVDPNVSFGGKLIGGIRVRRAFRDPSGLGAATQQDTGPNQAYEHQLKNNIANANNEETLKGAFTEAWRYAQGRNDPALTAELVKLKDGRKAELETPDIPW